MFGAFEAVPEAGGDPIPADAALAALISHSVAEEARWAAARFSAIADLVTLRIESDGRTERDWWKCDGWASVAAEIAAAAHITVRTAQNQMRTALALRHRLPAINAMFREGQISAAVATMISYRTQFVDDDAVLLAIDHDLAEYATSFAMMPKKGAEAAIDFLIAHYDPDAVCQSRRAARNRGLDWGRPDDATGTTSVRGALRSEHAEVVKKRIAQMVELICGKDPRTRRQCDADALYALAMGYSRLQCLCGDPECEGAQPVEQGSVQIHIHVVADKATLDTPPDPDVNGGDDWDYDIAPWETPAPEHKPAAEPEPESEPTSDSAPAQEEPFDEPTQKPERSAPAESSPTDSVPAEPESGPGPGPAPADPLAGSPEPVSAESLNRPSPAEMRESPPEPVCPVPEPSAPADSSPTDADPPPRPPVLGTHRDMTPEERRAALDRIWPTLAQPPKIRPTPKRQPTAVILGGAVLTPAQVGDLVRGGAKVSHLKSLDDWPAEPHYRPSAALAAAIRARDMHCRFPNCFVPADRCQLDHTVPWPLGATHPSNLKCYCTLNHLLKTFWGGRNGWRDEQLPDGTVIITAPNGQRYTTKPGSRLFFPSLTVDTGPAPPNLVKDTHPQTDPNKRATRMPKRRITREQQRRYRITAQRTRNRKLNAEAAEGDP